jgi:molybdenum cofactor cytidylyltransferase
VRVEAIVLAAGESRRMGCGKLTLPFGESTVLETVLQRLRAAGLAEITVVLGFRQDEIAPLFTGTNVRTVINPHPEQGMLSSVQCGLRSLQSETDAVLIAPGDQPQLDVATVHALLQAAPLSDRSLFIPTYAGKRGHPILIRTCWKDDILALPLDGGLNRFVAVRPEAVAEIACASPGLLEDLDTPDDYARATGKPVSTPLPESL